MMVAPGTPAWTQNPVSEDQPSGPNIVVLIALSKYIVSPIIVQAASDPAGKIKIATEQYLNVNISV